jgi:hypothetical protein
VVVAPSRAEAIAHAARTADVLVLDGIAQLTPARASLALLAVDPSHPWGRHPTSPPRAPVRMLAAACDGVVSLGEGKPAAGLFELGRPLWPAEVASRGVWMPPSSGLWGTEGTLTPWSAVCVLRVGLLTALARPDRILASLARRGVVPAAIVSGPDHGPLGPNQALDVERAEGRLGIDLWLATAKCALHAARSMPWLRVAVLDHRVVLHEDLRTRLRGLVGVATGRRNLDLASTAAAGAP